MKSSKRLTSWLLVLTLILSLGLLTVPAAAAEELEITIFHTNDTHGRFYPDPYNKDMIGVDKIAAVKASVPGSLLVDAGDTFHGLPLVNLKKGENAVELMKLAGYDVMTPGNHDFNYGSDRLLELIELAGEGENGFDIISANIRSKDDGSLILPAVSVKEVNGVKIGFFGLTTDETPVKTSPTNVETLDFADYITSAEAAIAELKDLGATVIVCLAHVSREPSLEELAETLGEDIDVIIDGHDHLSSNETVNGVLIAGSGQYEANLGKITLDIDPETGSVTAKTAELIAKAALADVEPVAAVTDAAELMMEDITPLYETVIGTSEQHMSSARGDENTPGVRTAETEIGNLVADAIRIMMDTDIAFINGGGIRADINAGDITVGDMYAILPFANYAVVKALTPVQLKLMLENSVSRAPIADGRFCQVSGMSFVYDVNKPAGERVISVTVGENEIDLEDTDTTYTLVINDFMAIGGDDFAVAAELDTVTEGDFLNAVLASYIEMLCEDGTGITAEIEGRITMLDNPAEWAEEAVDQAAELGLVPDALQRLYTKTITRAEFCELAAALIETVTGEEIETLADFSDTENESVRKLGGIGVVSGDGTGAFNPSGVFTREQVAVITAQIYEYLGETLEEAEADYTDADEISAWALAAVGSAQGLDIMVGIPGPDGNAFGPALTCDRQSSIMVIWNLFNNLAA